MSELMKITLLGEARFASPQGQTVREGLRMPARIVEGLGEAGDADVSFELAGPRARLFFDAQETRAGIVTCGGLCPGLNNVIRSVFLELREGYGVRQVLGFRDGYMGLDPGRAREPIVLTEDFVDHIHLEGGTVLGTSRGPVDPGVAVENLMRRKVQILFMVGGDGTLRGGNALFEEAQRRRYPLAVVGIPKTVDNDVPFVARTFGYLTAVEEAGKVLVCAHTEARSVRNGISLVKLMGRHAGFIAIGATIVSQDVNFCLIPEVPLRLEGEGGFLAQLKRRVLDREHAVIVVAEGAGQELLAGVGGETGKDASGNARLRDIGPYLRERIEEYFKAEGIGVTLRYFDPSYLIRSVPVSSEDAIMCDQYARHAVHAAMAGKTGLVIGFLHDAFVHVPIGLLTSRTKRVELNGAGWRAALAATGQPERWE
jgi:6-phosphofructokinase 1